MTTEAPRAFNRHIYHQKDSVFYGTDDGSQDGSFAEFPEFEKHYHSLDPARHENIHMISVVGGLYGLNLIPLWKPKKLTIFDINPMAITYFQVIHRVWTTSDSAQHFLNRLTNGDYEVDTEDEQFVKENICLRRANKLPRSRGSSKRSYEESWQYALQHFELTKQIFIEVPLEIRTEPMESESFAEMIRNQRDLWIYASNITQFHYFDLVHANPSNVVIIQIIHPEQPQLLDLASCAGKPVTIKFQIPLSVEPLNP